MDLIESLLARLVPLRKEGGGVTALANAPVRKQRRRRRPIDGYLVRLGIRLGLACARAEMELVASLVADPVLGCRLARELDLDTSLFDQGRARFTFSLLELCGRQGVFTGDRPTDRLRLAGLLCRAAESRAEGLDVAAWEAGDWGEGWSLGDRRRQLFRGSTWSPAIVATLFDLYFPCTADVERNARRLLALHAAQRDGRAHFKRAVQLLEEVLAPVDPARRVQQKRGMEAAA